MWILRAKGLHGDGSKKVGKIRGSEWANQNLGFMKKSYEMTPVLSKELRIPAWRQRGS